MEAVVSFRQVGSFERVAYWEEKIHYIHQAKNYICNFSLVVTITCKDQRSCNNVMCEHLPMVLSACLNIDNHDLLKPECILDEDIPFSQPTNLAIRPISPQFT